MPAPAPAGAPRAAWAALVVALALGLAAPGFAGPEIGFVYVEGNVGGASGGHAGLRFGDVVFHRQRSPDGIFWIVREPWASFRFTYGTLQNRPMHLATLPVGEASYEAARLRFTQERTDQRLRVEALRAARRNRVLLESLAETPGQVTVRGAGLVDPTRTGDADAEALRRTLASTLGPRFLADARQETERELREAAADLASGDEADATRVRLLLERRAALEAVAGAYGLEPDELVDADTPSGLPLLTPSEREAVRAWADQLEATAAALLRSTRPDRGYPLLLAAARHQAVVRSLREGRLLLLDPYPDDARRIGEGEVRRRHDELSALAGHARRRYREARASLAGANLDEARWNRLEARAARYQEAWRGANLGGPVRKVDGPLLPERGGLRRIDLPRPGGAAIQRARAGEEARAAELADHYGYDLLRRNCVTELQRTLVAAFPDPVLRVAALGGDLRPGEGFGYIPFVWFEQVVATLRVSRVERLAPYRERAVAALVAGSSSPWRTGARERSTLTGSVYHPRDRDGSFLFFTDDLRFSRPLFGLGNVTFGLADALVGLLAAPFDRGSRLRRAGRGVFFSLPELAFFNIRKGSFDAASLPPPDPASLARDRRDEPGPGLGAVGEIVEVPSGAEAAGL